MKIKKSHCMNLRPKSQAGLILWAGFLDTDCEYNKTTRRKAAIYLVKPKAYPFLRYPGGKRRFLAQLLPHIADPASTSRRYIEPFIGGGAIFFAIAPQNAILSDINRELITVYRGIRRSPKKVWRLYENFPDTKEAYYEIRGEASVCSDITISAARTLYLNRTCFKGMWRHNAIGEFNVGYGGQQRRWVLSYEALREASKLLCRAKLRCGDFEVLIHSSQEGDFIFCDPPYKPSEIESLNSHYVHAKFTLADHRRLALSLNLATQRGVKWAITTTSHPEVVNFFDSKKVLNFVTGTGSKPGVMTRQTGEVLICNF